MSENWDADARVGVPMMQMIAKQVSQHKHSPREVRRIIDAQWLDEDSKQQLRETFRVTDADLAAAEREAADQARRLTRERYGVPIPTGPCDCDAEFLVHPSGRIECRNCGAEWAAEEVRKVIDAQWLDEESKQQLRETFRVTDADLAAKERDAAEEREPAQQREAPATHETAPPQETATPPQETATPPQETKEGEAADKRDEAGEHEAKNGGHPANGRNPAPPAEAKAKSQAKSQAANGREEADPPAEGGQPRPAKGRAVMGKRGKAGKRPAPGPREDTDERPPAKQRETAGQAGSAD
ncbi:MAG TPA: hypothetical protein VH480_02300 [Streptosporangiaceae bacterium]